MSYVFLYLHIWFQFVFFLGVALPRRGALRKYANAETHTFSLDRDVFILARKIAKEKFGKSLNELINDYLRQLVVEHSDEVEVIDV